MRKRVGFLLVLLVGLGIAWLLWRQRRSIDVTPPSVAAATAARPEVAASPQNAPVPQSRSSSPLPSSPPVDVKQRDAESEKRYLDKIAPILQRSLSFYGKVVDEQNRPVSAAKVRFSLMNNPSPNGSGTSGETESNQDGRFVINGRGMGIYVEVSKEGYYQVPAQNGKLGSSGGFRNHENLADTERGLPPEDNPAVFVLRKVGESVALVHVGPRSIIVPKNGAPTNVDVSTGQVVASGKGLLRVEVWTQNQGMNPNKGEHYDWRCRLTIPGGGIIDRSGEFDFEAPAAGYLSTVELAQSATTDQWTPSMAKQFFVRLPDDRYARINFQIATNGDHFIMLESFLNPTPGNRNLEFDPSKAITPR